MYAEAVAAEAKDQHLDIYIPGSLGGYPPIIWAHSSNRDKTTGRTLARVLARNGFVVLSIDWRDDGAQEALENGLCALRFIAGQAGEYGADPQQIIWAGFSAGAWLGSMVSLSQGDLLVTPISNQVTP